MRKSTIAAAAAAALVAGGTTAFSAFANDGHGGGGNDGGRVLRVHERGLAANYVPAGAGSPVGDAFVFSSDILDNRGRVIGRDGAECVFTNPDQTVICTVGMTLPGGQLTFSGLAKGTDNVFSITGGTGIYRGARGEAHVVDTATPGSSDITITITSTE